MRRLSVRSARLGARGWVAGLGLALGAALLPRVVPAQSAAPRIVSLSSAVTEVLFALGVGDQVTAVAQGVAYPEAATRKPMLGPARTVTAEAVLAQRPTLVLGDTMVPATTVQQLRAAGVRVVLLPGDAAANVTARIRQVGTLIGKASAAAALADSVGRDLAAVQSLPKLPVRVLFIYARSTTTAFVSGAGTGADEIIGMAGAGNAVGGFSGYRPLTAEAVATSNADVIVVPARGLSSIGGVAALRKLPGVSLTPAARAGRIVAIDDQLLLSFGPRTAMAVRQLRAEIETGGEKARPAQR
jgi:iron complex transport system substrate-binding protein